MALTPTEEQGALRDVMRAFVGKHSSEAQLRKLIDSGESHDHDAWQALSGQIGAPALAVPEEYGGVGFGLGELAVILEEAGRALFPSPFLASSVLATYAIVGADDPVLSGELLPQMASGDVLATVAVSDTGLDLVDGGGTHADSRNGRWTVTGVKEFVLAAPAADFALVSATAPSGLSLFVVDLQDSAAVVHPRAGVDPTRSFGRLVLDDAPARLLGVEGAAIPVLARLSDIASVALACEQLGAASAVLDGIVEYLKMRHQFGRPIGSFQALKHRCADLLVELEQSRSAVVYAVTAVERDADDLSVAASIANVACSEALYHVAAESIQMYGGIGFTWEHPAHLYFKRAELDRTLFGSPDQHRARIARRVGLASSNI